MSLKLKTITALADAQQLDDTTWFGVSQEIAGTEQLQPKYTSKKVSYKTIRTTLENELSTSIASTFKLNAVGGQPIDVSGLEKTVNALSSYDCSIDGRKTFMVPPVVDGSVEYGKNVTVSDNMLPTVKYVKSLVHNNGDYITDETVVVGAPGNNARYTVFDRNFMHWKIGENQTDSSEYIDTTGYPVGPKVCTHTGNLVIYGWLADNGNVEPQDAWVGLYGCIHTSADEDNKRDWVLLQLQPWPLTSRSSVFQYVGFNVKVAKGLMLKIKTGFRVKGKNSGFQAGSSLTYWTNQPNSFVGYFLTTADEYNAV